MSGVLGTFTCKPVQVEQWNRYHTLYRTIDKLFCTETQWTALASSATQRAGKGVVVPSLFTKKVDMTNMTWQHTNRNNGVVLKNGSQVLLHWRMNLAGLRKHESLNRLCQWGAGVSNWVGRVTADTYITVMSDWRVLYPTQHPWQPSCFPLWSLLLLSWGPQPPVQSKF